MSDNGAAMDLQVAFDQWRTQMTEGELLAVIEVFEGIEPDSIGSINKLLMALTVGMLKAQVSPVVSNAILPLVDRMIVNIHSVNVAHGLGHNTGSQAVELLREAASRAKPKATYQLPDVQVIDAEDMAPKKKTKTRARRK